MKLKFWRFWFGFVITRKKLNENEKTIKAWYKKRCKEQRKVGPKRE